MALPETRYDFNSDNTAPAAPEAMAAVLEANAGFVASYGADPVTARASDLIRQVLDADAEVRFVASGTAANAIALAALCQPSSRSWPTSTPTPPPTRPARRASSVTDWG